MVELPNLCTLHSRARGAPLLQDNVTVQELAVEDRAGDVKGWLQRLHTWLFDRDIFAGIASDSTLLRIHSTAEEYEPAAEDCYVPFQARPSS